MSPEELARCAAITITGLGPDDVAALARVLAGRADPADFVRDMWRRAVAAESRPVEGALGLLDRAAATARTSRDRGRIASAVDLLDDVEEP